MTGKSRQYQGSQPLPDHLTLRQRQVLQLLAQGLTSRQIAARLGCSERTARNRLSDAYERLQVHSGPQAVAKALQLGLLERSVADPQPVPVSSERPAIQDLVSVDVAERKQQGIQKYGTVLQGFNGRDALIDAYQEALDLVQYLRQALYERDGR